MPETITLSDLVEVTKRGATPLASETALFILLQAAEVLRDTPGQVGAEKVRITAEGDVEIDGRPVGGEAAAIKSIATMAEATLSPMPVGMRGALERIRTGELASMAALRAGLEALLVPLNRAAARRVLGRLVREHAAQAVPGASATEPDGATANALDTQRDGIPRLPPPPRLGDLASLPSGAERLATDTEPEGRQLVSDSMARSATDTEPDAPLDASASPPPVRRSGSGTALAIVFVMAAAAALYALWTFYGH